MRTLSLKTWFPITLLVVAVFGILVNTLITGYMSHKQQLASIQSFVSEDLQRLAAELGELIAIESADDIDRRLEARVQASNYESFYLIRIVDWSILTMAGEPRLELLTADNNSQQPLDILLNDRGQRLDYDSTAQLITGYMAVPTQQATGELLRDGLIVAFYNASGELAGVSQTLWQGNVSFAAVFLLMIAVLQWLNHRYLQLPVNQLIHSVNAFAKKPRIITRHFTGRSEFADIENALYEMSITLLKVGAEKQIAQHEVKKGSVLLDSVFTALPDLLFLLNENLEIVDYRSSSQNSLYRSPDEFLGKMITDVMPPQICKLTIEHVAEVKCSGDVSTFSYDLSLTGDEDDTRHYEARVAMLPNSEKIMVIVRDITEHWESELLIEKQAYFDSLTELPNRYLALDRLNSFTNEAQRHHNKVAVMFLDLDDFKKINDTLGHSIGDQLLIDVAKRLQGAIRKTDTIARLGGDEFMILVSSLNQMGDLQMLVDKVFSTIARPFTIEGRELVVTCSMGIAIYPVDSKNNGDLLRKADMAMYHAKAQGKSQYAFFTEEMNKSIARRLQLEQNMLSALRNGEYEVHYQPQFQLADTRLLGAEALLRWQSPELGAISPAEFIPIAEQNGHIIALGYFVIEQAIAQCAQWRKLFHPTFRIAINLSPRQLRDNSILEFVQKQLMHHQLDGSNLEFEITEGVLLSAQENVKEVLHGFRRLGIKLSMDDFGTGYSSLSYLQQYPFDLVKIDRSFINNIEHSDHSRSLVKAIIGMAHSLNLKVLAEGVETQQQADLLTQYDCDLMQGFLMGPAQKADTFYSQWSTLNSEQKTQPL